MRQLFLASLVLLFISCNSEEEVPTPTAENWVLTEKNRFDYKLNDRGNPDTTFIYNLKYKDGVVSDSSTSFVVNTWKDNFVTKESSYTIGKNGVNALLTTTHYEYDGKGRTMRRRVEAQGKLIAEQRYVYVDSTGLSKSTSIQIKNYNLSTGKQLDLTFASPQDIGYDTINSIYEYDQTKKVIGTKFLAGNGKLLSHEVTVYSGNDPLLTASISPDGDTLKRITYEKNEKVLMTVTETDSVVLFQNLVNGVPIAQKTKYKNRKEEWRSAVIFDPATGRKREDNLYKLQ